MTPPRASHRITEACLASPLLTLALLTTSGCDSPPGTAFEASVESDAERIWVGPDFYANRLQDWRLRDGRIESIEGGAAKPMRTLHLLTRALSESAGTMTMSVRTGAIEPGPAHEDTWSGFLIGVGGAHVDFRISALSHHWPSTDGGLIVAVDGTGRIIVRDNSVNHGYTGPNPNIPVDNWPLVSPDRFDRWGEPGADMRLTLEARPAAASGVSGDGPDGDTYRLTVTLADGETREVLTRSTYSGIASEHLTGNVALVSHRSPLMDGPGYWFRDWQLAGSKVERHDDRAFGPIMGAMYTLSRGTLKMTAQLGPLGESDSPSAHLEVFRDAGWSAVDTADIQPLSATAHFRVDDWPGDEDVPYRVAYDLGTAAGGSERHYFEGRIRAIPSDDREFVLAGLNCHHISGAGGQWNADHFWYPHNETVAGVAYRIPT